MNGEHLRRLPDETATAVDWRPLAETSDLPKFVYAFDEKDGYRQTYEIRRSGKTRTLAKVRMETPVIYFYTKEEMEVSVNVQFPSGKITEWYPQASIVKKSREILFRRVSDQTE